MPFVSQFPRHVNKETESESEWKLGALAWSFYAYSDFDFSWLLAALFVVLTDQLINELDGSFDRVIDSVRRGESVSGKNEKLSWQAALWNKIKHKPNYVCCLSSSSSSSFFFFCIVSSFSIMKTITPLVHAGLFWCFHNTSGLVSSEGLSVCCLKLMFTLKRSTGFVLSNESSF